MPFGDWVYKKLGYKRIAVLSTDTSMGWDAVGGFQKTFEEAGGKIVQKIWVPVGFKNFTVYLDQLREDADAVFVVAPIGAAEVILREYGEKGIKKPIIGGGATFASPVLAHAGRWSVGAISPHTYSADLKTPENRAFVAAYTKRYKRIPSQLAEAAYTSAIWIHRAIDRINGDVENKDKLMAALRSSEEIKTPRGPMKLDSYGNPIQNVYVRKVEMLRGQAADVVIDRFPMVSQFYKYSPQEFLKQPPFSADYPPCRYCSK
jgi:branched-chain amino acid transport system substrate-binding protein